MRLTGIRLYTGIHKAVKNLIWHNFWNRKLTFHKNADKRVDVFTTPLHYNNGVPSEKGVDIRIALDLVRAARLNRCDVVVLFSRDTDFAEVAKEIRDIAREKQRWIKIASVIPDHPSMKRGIDGTDWLRLTEDEYNLCLDPNVYRSCISKVSQALHGILESRHSRLSTRGHGIDLGATARIAEGILFRQAPSCCVPVCAFA